MSITVHTRATGAFQGTTMTAVLLAVGSLCFPAAPALAVDCNPIKVWTFNIRFDSGWHCLSDCDNAWVRTVGREARRDLAQLYMLTYRPDIFGLQEVRDPPTSAARASQLNDIAGWFPGHAHYAEDRGDGEHAAIFWRTDRFVAFATGTFWLSCQPNSEGSIHPDAEHPRITSWVRLFDVFTGEFFYVFNTHWECQPCRGRDTRAAREYSAALMRAKIAEITAVLGASPVLVLGDLNANEHSNAFAILTGDSLLTGTSCLPLPVVPQQDLPLINSYREANPGGVLSIDHILHSNGDWRPFDAERRTDSYVSSACDAERCFPSDHRAVEVSFRPLSDDVFVDFNQAEAGCEAGTAALPFNTLTEGAATVRPGATLHVRAGVTTEDVRIDRPMTIEAEGGLVRIRGS